MFSEFVHFEDEHHRDPDGVQSQNQEQLHAEKGQVALAECMDTMAVRQCAIRHDRIQNNQCSPYKQS